MLKPFACRFARQTVPACMYWAMHSRFSAWNAMKQRGTGLSACAALLHGALSCIIWRLARSSPSATRQKCKIYLNGCVDRNEAFWYRRSCYRHYLSRHLFIKCIFCFGATADRLHPLFNVDDLDDWYIALPLWAGGLWFENVFRSGPISQTGIRR